MSLRTGTNRGVLMLLAGALGVTFTLGMNAQVQTKKTVTNQAAPTVQTKVESGEVVYVNGNELAVRMSDGSIRHFSNVPESARATVNGQEIGIHDVKVGMKLQKTITTTTVPKMITTVKTVTGKVWYVNPPRSVILTLEDGKNQEFKIPNGQKFDIDGQKVDAWGLKKGMTVTATKIVEQPETVVRQQAKLTGSMPPPPPPPPAQPILVAVMVPVPVPAAEPAPAPAPELPKTGSTLPLIGLLGLLLVGASFGMKALRHKA